MMAPSYKKADATILALIESLILSYVEQVIFYKFHLYMNIYIYQGVPT